MKYICPTCKKGKHNLCSPEYCDCIHSPFTESVLTNETGIYIPRVSPTCSAGLPSLGKR